MKFGQMRANEVRHRSPEAVSFVWHIQAEDAADVFGKAALTLGWRQEIAVNQLVECHCEPSRHLRRQRGAAFTVEMAPYLHAEGLLHVAAD